VTTDPGSAGTAGRPTTADVLLRERTAAPDPGAYRFSPLVSWLVATARPEVVVELGPGDEPSLRSTGDAVLRSERGRTCAAVLLAGPASDPTGFATLTGGLSRHFGPAFETYESEESALSALPAGAVGLLHLSLFDMEDGTLPSLTDWQPVLAPGAVVVVTTTASDTSSLFVDMKGHLMDTFPAVSVSLGLTTEAIVAQRPDDDDATPIVHALQGAPFAVGAFLAVLGEQMELHHLLTEEPEPSEAVRALIGRVIDHQRAEREAFISALRVYKDETARLSDELVVARTDLQQQLEAARLEREHLLAEFLDRVDELSAKVSTTASRYRAELADTNALLEAEGRKAEAYAGQAAIAQSVLDDMRHSTSWRVTAPVRLLSRLLARKAHSPAQPEH
jgi:hypothetical protein